MPASTPGPRVLAAAVAARTAQTPTTPKEDTQMTATTQETPTTAPADPAATEHLVDTDAHLVDGAALLVDHDTGPDELGLVEAVRRIRLRHQLVPYPVVAMLWAGAAAAHLYPAGAVFAVGVALVAAVVWWIAWGRVSPVSRREQRRWTTTVVLAGTAWLGWAAVAGAGGGRAVVLWLAGYALAWPYWRRHAIPIPPEESAGPVDVAAAGPPAVVVVEAAPPVVRAWTRMVAVAGGVLPHSYLTDHRVVGRSQTWTVCLDAVRQNTLTAIGAQMQIAAALGQSLEAVTVDFHPSGGMDKALLMITPPESNPLRRKVVHPGMGTVYDPATGYARIGIHPDEAPAEWAFVVPGWGLAGGFLFGGPGSGKSALMTCLAATAAHTGVISVLAADPQGGTSMPKVMAHAHWPARDEAEIMRQLRALDKAIDIRGVLNDLRGDTLHTCTPVEPGLLLFLDEFHEIAKRGSEATLLLDKIARKGRKCGVAVIGASQDGELATFGGLDSMRLSIMIHNGVVLRTPSRIQSGLIPGLKVDPTAIPAVFPGTKDPTSGLGYLVGSRTAPFRGFWTPDDYDQAMTDAPNTPFDQVVANYIGADYTERHQRTLAARGESLARISELDPGSVARLVTANPELADALAAYQARATTPAGQAGRAGTGTVTVLRIPPAPVFHPDGPPPPPKTKTAPERIYELIRAGVASPGELRTRTGYSEARVHTALRELEDAGRVRRVGHGRYTTAA